MAAKASINWLVFRGEWEGVDNQVFCFRAHHVHTILNKKILTKKRVLCTNIPCASNKEKANQKGTLEE